MNPVKGWKRHFMSFAFYLTAISSGNHISTKTILVGFEIILSKGDSECSKQKTTESNQFFMLPPFDM